MEKQRKQKDPKSIRVYRVLRWILIPFVLLIMAVSTAQLIRIVLEYREGEETYRSVSDRYVTVISAPAPGGQSAPEPYPAQTAASTQTQTPEPSDSPAADQIPPEQDHSPVAPITVNFDRLFEMNADCIGWIYIPETNISYPLMQAENNSKYLNVLPDGTKNKAGSIFMDARNDPAFSDCNTVIYGHRLRDGTMFSSLNKYKDRSFFDAHRTVYLLTPDKDYLLSVFACQTVSAIGDAYEMYPDPESLQAYLEKAQSETGIFERIDYKSVDRIVTLSTCTGNFGTRTVLLCTVTPLS